MKASKTIDVKCQAAHTQTKAVGCSAGKWTAPKCEKDCTFPVTQDKMGTSTAVSKNNGGGGGCKASGTFAGGSTCVVDCDQSVCNTPASSCTVKTVAKCVDGTITQPKCAKKVCDWSTGFLQHGHGSKGTCNNAIAAGKSCKPTCDSGYTLTDGTLTCDAKGDKPSLGSAGNEAKCEPTKCKISSVENAGSVTGTCTGGTVSAIDDTKSCTLTGCSANFYMPSHLAVQCDDGKMTCVGCHDSCKPGQNCLGGTADKCTACRDGFTSGTVKGDGTRTCAQPTGWTTDKMTITQVVKFADITKTDLKDTKYAMCYGTLLGVATSCTGTFKTGAKVTAALVSRRATVSVSYLVKIGCPTPVTTVCKNMAALAAQKATYMTKAQLVGAMAGKGLKSIESILAANIDLSSASSTTITAVTAVVAMVIGLFWQ